MLTIGIYMDPLEKIDFLKDSTIAIIRHLQDYAKIKLIMPDSVSYNSCNVTADICDMKIHSLTKREYSQRSSCKVNLNKLDCIFFRKDPPVDNKYIIDLLIFKELEYQGTLVLNSPQSLLQFNEKLLGNQLSIPKIPTLVTSNVNKIYNFLRTHDTVVLKPMNMMGGQGILKINKAQKSKTIIQEYIDQYKIIIAQKFLDEIKNGDNRIIIYNGIIEENVLTRYPPKGDFIANLSNGGKFKITKLKKKYHAQLQNVASFLKYHGIFFAGVDMIGDHITEINFTSPTGVQQIKNNLSKNIASELLNTVRNYLV